jgi:uncharacterized protein YbaP (TraB family)
MHRRWLALVLATGCAHASCPPARPHAAADPFLWQVTGGGGVVYLFGTLHVAGLGDVPAAARAALEASPIFADEAGPMPPDAVRAHAYLPRGQSLDELIGSDDWYDLLDAVGARFEDDLKRARPWYAMALLTSALAPRSGKTMDDALEDEARGRGVAVEHLESADEQLAALADSVSPDDLKQAIRERRDMRCGLTDLVAAYRAGDGAAVRGDATVEVERHLLDERNARWLPRLEAYLAGPGAFVAVGVSHLVGPRSLPELLAARGWRVARTLNSARALAKQPP